MIRIPRPFGVTQLMTEYHSTNNLEAFEIVRITFIQQWLLKNGYALGRRMTILELAEFLKCEPSVINQFMVKQVISTKLFNDDNRQEWVDQIISQQLVWNIEDRMDAQNQHDLLLKSQGDSYKPFISAEVTKVLNLKQGSTQNLGSLLAKISGTQKNINIFNPLEAGKEVEKPTYAEVIEIIQDEKNSLSNKEVVSMLETKYDLLSLPEVNARGQTDVDTEKEGLKILNSDLKKITDDYKGSIQDSEKVHHELRREIELKIVDDEGLVTPEPDFSKLEKKLSKSPRKK